MMTLFSAIFALTPCGSPVTVALGDLPSMINVMGSIGSPRQEVWFSSPSSKTREDLGAITIAPDAIVFTLESCVGIVTV